MYRIKVENNEAPEFIGQIIDVFDDFLEDRDVHIPSSEEEKKEDAEWEENSARIYGTDYDEIAGRLDKIMRSWPAGDTKEDSIKDRYCDLLRDYFGDSTDLGRAQKRGRFEECEYHMLMCGYTKEDIHCIYDRAYASFYAVPEEGPRRDTPKYGTPRVISEMLEYTGGGVNFLTYEIEAEENGKKSVFYAFYLPDEDAVIFRRAAILDPYETCGDEEWCDIPDGLPGSAEFKDIVDEIKARMLSYLHGTYKMKYPEREYGYDPSGVYEDKNGKRYHQIFSLIREGKTIWYGYPVDKKTGTADYEHVKRIGEKKLTKVCK